MGEGAHIREMACKERRGTHTGTHVDMHKIAHFYFSFSLFICVSVLPRVCACVRVRIDARCIMNVSKCGGMEDNRSLSERSHTFQVACESPHSDLPDPYPAHTNTHTLSVFVKEWRGAANASTVSLTHYSVMPPSLVAHHIHK